MHMMTAILRPQLIPRGVAPQFWFPHLAPYRHLALALLGIGRSGVMAPPLGIKSKIMSSWSSLICLLPIFCLFHLHLARRKTHKTCRYVTNGQLNGDRSSLESTGSLNLADVYPQYWRRTTWINQSLKLESSFHFFLNFNWCCNL